jgi:hypothetical protein
MGWNRLYKIALGVLGGGTLLQTTAGCEQLIAPLVADLVAAIVLQTLLGGLAT